MAYIEFDKVDKIYQTGEVKIKALNDTTFTIEKGELVCILGPSGAGKTTCLNILGGMDKLTNGKVIVDGKRIDKLSDKELIKYRRNDIGFVFQFYNLIQNMTVLENVELAIQLCSDYLDPNMILDKVGLKNRKNNFEIITCARFDFPHKGYIIGLVKAFNNLKFVYPQLTLTIVGYGEGEQYLKEIINELPDYSKKDINLLGKLLPHELQKAFCKATLNVGLAGALNVGARCALPSIPVRHYTYDCECYGFYENSGESALSTKPGDNIEDYISETVNCSDKEYVLHGLSAYKKANNNNNVDPEYIFKQHNRSNLPIFSKFDFLKFNFINFMICIMRKIFKIKSYDDTNGT